MVLTTGSVGDARVRAIAEHGVGGDTSGTENLQHRNDGSHYNYSHKGINLFPFTVTLELLLLAVTRHINALKSYW